MDTDTCKSFVHGLVLSQLDYANALLYGINKSEIRKLQSIQNMAARIILKLPPRTDGMQALFKLHWLPIEYRINFKLNVRKWTI